MRAAGVGGAQNHVKAQAVEAGGGSFISLMTVVAARARSWGGKLMADASSGEGWWSGIVHSDSSVTSVAWRQRTPLNNGWRDANRHNMAAAILMHSAYVAR